jgi:alcohol dehydrogenase class IV
MIEATDIEKKSLEAHVELCAERYRNLEMQLASANASISGVKSMVTEVHEMVHKMGAERNDQLIGWGIGIIGFLIATVGWLISRYVLV